MYKIRACGPLKSPFLFLLSAFAVANLFAINAQAVEESLDLDDVTEQVKPVSRETTTQTSSAHAVSLNRFSLMGRVDITSETSAPNEDSTHQMKNNHFLVFLKVNASPKTSFMGQLISEDPNNVFYYVDHRPYAKLNVQFGKIIVPFGDTRKFHHIYGGVQSFGANGVMLPNIWAATGFNLAWQLGESSLDTYVVNSAVDGNANTVNDPEIAQDANNQRQAYGARYTLPTQQRVTALLSAYQGSYSPGRGLDLNILGVDVYSDYGAWGLNIFKRLRFALGMAHATFESRPDEGDVRQTGDYFELVTNALWVGEARLRYGTYIDNHKIESVRDTHALAVGYSLPVDVMRVMAEYQLNYEAINERDNDLFRVMVSLDF